MVILLILLLIGFIGCLIFYMIAMPGKSYSGPFLPLTVEEQAYKQKLDQHIHFLADKIGPRHLQRHKALHDTALYIKQKLIDAGLEVQIQEYRVDNIVCENVIAELKGKASDEIVVVGAHYDTVMPNCVGANDNGSGVAAVLALAQTMVKTPQDKTIRFAFFVNEEPPYFQTEHMGSLHYAKMLREKNEKVGVMLSLEAIGYYTDVPNSQSYSFPFGWFYPSVGNFVAFIGGVSSRSVIHKAIKVFRETTPFPSEGGAVPAFIPGVSWSDHWAFWQQGYPAFMITDTALFRYPYYHTIEDTPDKFNTDHLARVVQGLEKVIQSFATSVHP